MDEGFDAAALAGGTAAWEAAELPFEAGMTRLLVEPDDVYLRAYDGTDPVEIEKAMNDYLEWEIGLVAQIARPGGVTFRVYPE